MTLKIVQKYMTKNDCYKVGRKIKVRGLMLHSTATPGVMAAAWFNRWNKPNMVPAKCVHAFIDDKECYQYLPWDHRGWHGGGKANDTHIGVEMCEPKNLRDKTYFKKVWNNTVELFAMLCERFNLTEKDIIGHYEGYRLGIASNHADPAHWFPMHGESMDSFRAAVKARLAQKKKAATAPPAQEGSYVVKSGDTLWGIAHDADKGAGKITVEQLKEWNGLKSNIIVPGQRLWMIKPPAPSKPAEVPKTERYTVVTDLKGYYRAADAKIGKNPLTTIKPGTYYIYKKDKDGIYNLTKTEGVAGSWVDTKLNTKAAFEVGQRVKVKVAAKKYATDENIPSWVKGKTYTIQQVKSDRVLLREIISWVKKEDVEPVK